MKKYLYITIEVVLICLFFTCNSKQFNCNSIESTIDTLIVNKSDTIWAKDTIIQFKNRYIPVIKEAYLDTTHDTLSVCDSIRIYDQEVNDSNLTVFTTNTVKGKLLGQIVSYKLKIPIKIIDSVFINITKTNEAKLKGHLMVGIGTSEGFQNLNISPLVGYQAPNGRLLLYEYNTFSKSHNIKALIPLSFPKKVSKQ